MSSSSSFTYFGFIHHLLNKTTNSLVLNPDSRTNWTDENQTFSNAISNSEMTVMEKLKKLTESETLKSHNEEYEKFLIDVWIGIVLTSMILCCVFCMCSCLMYNKYQQWKIDALQRRITNRATRRRQNNSNTRDSSLSNSSLESLPDYTIVSGLPTYDEAIEKIKKDSDQLIIHCDNKLNAISTRDVAVAAQNQLDQNHHHHQQQQQQQQQQQHDLLAQTQLNSPSNKLLDIVQMCKNNLTSSESNNESKTTKT